MKKFAFLLSLVFIFWSGAAAQNRPVAVVVPADFKSDGCSMFPDGGYRDCCDRHDRAYYVGGNWKQRWRADKELFKCVAAKPGFKYKFIASVMWLGVRFGGVDWLPTSYRWGFGQKKTRKRCENKCQNVLTTQQREKFE